MAAPRSACAPRPGPWPRGSRRRPSPWGCRSSWGAEPYTNGRAHRRQQQSGGCAVATIAGRPPGQHAPAARATGPAIDRPARDRLRLGGGAAVAGGRGLGRGRRGRGRPRPRGRPARAGTACGRTPSAPGRSPTPGSACSSASSGPRRRRPSASAGSRAACASRRGGRPGRARPRSAPGPPTRSTGRSTPRRRPAGSRRRRSAARTRKRAARLTALPRRGRRREALDRRAGVVDAGAAAPPGEVEAAVGVGLSREPRGGAPHAPVLRAAPRRAQREHGERRRVHAAGERAARPLLGRQLGDEVAARERARVAPGGRRTRIVRSISPRSDSSPAWAVM